MLLATSISFSQENFTKATLGNIITIHNKGGQTIGYSTDSGVKILTVDGFAFKDLNKNGTLDKYEDWRLPFDARAKDLASQMSIEQIAGLMLYSRHQTIPVRAGGFMGRVESGTIKVYFNDMKTPVMETVDKTFLFGEVGLGSFDDTGNFDNLIVRGTVYKPAE